MDNVLSSLLGSRAAQPDARWHSALRALDSWLDRSRFLQMRQSDNLIALSAVPKPAHDPVVLPTTADSQAPHADDAREDKASDNGVSNTGVRDTGVHETSVHETSVHETSVHDTGVHDTGVHDTSPNDISLHDTSIRDTSLNDTSANDTSLHDTSLHDTSLHDTSLHDTSLHGTSIYVTPLHGISDHDEPTPSTSIQKSPSADRHTPQTHPEPPFRSTDVPQASREKRVAASEAPREAKKVAVEFSSVPGKPKRPRGRPRKHPVSGTGITPSKHTPERPQKAKPLPASDENRPPQVSKQGTACVHPHPPTDGSTLVQPPSTRDLADQMNPDFLHGAKTLSDFFGMPLSGIANTSPSKNMEAPKDKRMPLSNITNRVPSETLTSAPTSAPSIDAPSNPTSSTHSPASASSSTVPGSSPLAQRSMRESLKSSRGRPRKNASKKPRYTPESSESSESSCTVTPGSPKMYAFSQEQLDQIKDKMRHELEAQIRADFERQLQNEIRAQIHHVPVSQPRPPSSEPLHQQLSPLDPDPHGDSVVFEDMDPLSEHDENAPPLASSMMPAPWNVSGTSDATQQPHAPYPPDFDESLLEFSGMIVPTSDANPADSDPFFDNSVPVSQPSDTGYAPAHPSPKVRLRSPVLPLQPSYAPNPVHTVSPSSMLSKLALESINTARRSTRAKISPPLSNSSQSKRRRVSLSPSENGLRSRINSQDVSSFLDLSASLASMYIASPLTSPDPPQNRDSLAKPAPFSITKPQTHISHHNSTPTQDILPPNITQCASPVSSPQIPLNEQPSKEESPKELPQTNALQDSPKEQVPQQESLREQSSHVSALQDSPKEKSPKLDSPRDQVHHEDAPQVAPAVSPKQESPVLESPKEQLPQENASKEQASEEEPALRSTTLASSPPFKADSPHIASSSSPESPFKINMTPSLALSPSASNGPLSDSPVTESGHMISAPMAHNMSTDSGNSEERFFDADDENEPAHFLADDGLGRWSSVPLPPAVHLSELTVSSDQAADDKNTIREDAPPPSSPTCNAVSSGDALPSAECPEPQPSPGVASASKSPAAKSREADRATKQDVPLIRKQKEPATEPRQSKPHLDVTIPKTDPLSKVAAAGEDKEAHHVGNSPPIVSDSPSASREKRRVSSSNDSAAATPQANVNNVVPVVETTAATPSSLSESSKSLEDLSQDEHHESGPVFGKLSSLGPPLQALNARAHVPPGPTPFSEWSKVSRLAPSTLHPGPSTSVEHPVEHEEALQPSFNESPKSEPLTPLSKSADLLAKAEMFLFGRTRPDNKAQEPVSSSAHPPGLPALPSKTRATGSKIKDTPKGVPYLSNNTARSRRSAFSSASRPYRPRQTKDSDWMRTQNLVNALQQQNTIDPASVFGECKSPNASDLFRGF